MATVRPVKFTYEDYRTAPPDKRYELLDGDLVLVPGGQRLRFRPRGGPIAVFWADLRPAGRF